jgi:hypothetical protein
VSKVMKIHPDDIVMFTLIHEAAWRVARAYNLPLKEILGDENPDLTNNPATGQGCFGYCTADGRIRVALRGKEHGQWTAAPRLEDDIWRTVAHELAHLKHFNHGPAFQEFHAELMQALKNDRAEKEKSHQDKMIEKLIKLQAAREGEAQLGNTAAAEAFAAAINKMLIENELNPTDLDYARAADQDPVIQVLVDLKKYRIAHKKTRVAWQEDLARIVARGHLCTFLLRPGSNQIWFVGTRSHAMAAEYVYGMLVPAADYMSEKDAYYFKLKCHREGRPKDAIGFRPAWLEAFVQRIRERLQNAREEAVKQSTAFTGNETQALVRLNGAMRKVDEYIENRFRGRGGASILKGNSTNHAAGQAAGRAAADRLNIGRKGITSGVKGLL